MVSLDDSRLSIRLCAGNDASNSNVVGSIRGNSLCGEKLDSVLSYYKDDKTKHMIMSFYVSRHKVPVSYLLENGKHTGSKNNPFRFAKTFIATYFDIMRGIKNPNLLVTCSSHDIYSTLLAKHNESIKHNKPTLPIPTNILSVHGYRTDAYTSEMNAVVNDRGVIKIVVVKTIFTHGKWKVDYFEIVDARK
jgi:hypothetical protein